MKKEINTLNYYDGIARGYKQLYHDEQIKKISLIKDYLPNKGNLLDVGSGDGVLNSFVADEVKLISFDLSYELLKLNNNKIRIQGSILNLPFKDNSIDYISSFTVFQDLPDVTRGIGEVVRVLKKDGIFILSFLHLARDVSVLLEQINSKFEVVEEIREVKDFIFVLKKK